jgi:hypothetical protein
VSANRDHTPCHRVHVPLRRVSQDLQDRIPASLAGTSYTQSIQSLPPPSFLLIRTYCSLDADAIRKTIKKVMECRKTTINLKRHGFCGQVYQIGKHAEFTSKRSLFAIQALTPIPVKLFTCLWTSRISAEKYTIECILASLISSSNKHVFPFISL